MNRCARNGYLVDVPSSIPTDPTDVGLEDLPIVGCNAVRCSRCGALVRNAPGLAFRTPDEVASATLAALYATADLASSPLLHATNPDHRLYLCTCSRWLETGQHACSEPDPDPNDPSMPWACAGHPLIALPHDVDGVPVASQAEIGALATRGFHGFTPPRTRPADAPRAAWLARLHARLTPTDGRVVEQAALAALEDPEPRSRALALHYFYRAPSDAARSRLLDVLDGDRRLFSGVPDEATAVPKLDRTLEETIWRVLGPSVAASGRARDLARAEALAGKGSRALYDALARGDSDWMVSAAERVARATPERGEDLLNSFAKFPPGVPVRPVRERVREALATPAPTPHDGTN
jgi:hypothetical protein